MKIIICIILFTICFVGLYKRDVIASEKSQSELISKNQMKQLLDEENIIWKTDTDGDGLPDALEKILNTNIHSKDSDGDGIDDKLEIELELNPNSKDSDNNGVNDADEDSDNDGLSNKYELQNLRNPKIDDKFIKNVFTRSESIDVTGKTLLESCNLVWKRIDCDIVGKTIKEIFPNEHQQLHNFTVIRHTQTNGFSAIAIKNCDTTIVAYQASKTYRDWIGNFLTQFMPHPQRNASIEFIKPIMNKEEKIYITGHSLGGLLAQYATHYLSDQNYTKIKTITFNSANSMNPQHIEGKYRPPLIKAHLLGDYVLVYDYLISKISKNEEHDSDHLIDFFNKALKEQGFIDIYSDKWKNSDFNDKYDDVIENYIINKDPLYVIINGGYLGRKNVKDSDYKATDIVKDSESLSNAHKIENFKNDKNLDKVINIK
ncbi:MAG: lipase family protein [Peptostreptococcaceae bacterium]